MTTYSARTAASSDDAHMRNSGTMTLTGVLSVPGWGDTAGCAGMRFLNVNIPQGTTITSATLTLTAQASYTGPTTLIVKVACQAIDDGTTFTSTDGNLNTTNRTRTAYSSNWDIHVVTGGTTYSKDITAQVQAVISRTGFASGNDINVIIDNVSSPANEWQDFESYDSDSTKAPLLEIVYSSGTNGSVTAVTATCAADAPAPTVAGTRNPTVTGVVATSAAAMIAPAVSAGINASVTAVTMTATAAAPAPAGAGVMNGSVAAVATTAAADMPTPAVSGGGNASVTAVTATATAAMIPPGVTGLGASHEISVGNGFTDGSAQQHVRTSEGRLFIASWQFDHYPQGSDTGLGETLRMYRADQVGTPTSFTRIDSGNEPSNAVSWALAIDGNNLIHVLWAERAAWTPPGTINNLKYCTFSTANGTWGSAVTIDNAVGITNENGQGDEQVAMAIDASNVVHIVYLKSDGTRRRVNYRNNSGGSWSSAIVIDDQSFSAGQYCQHPGICFDTNGNRVASWVRGSGEGNSDGRAFVRVYASGAWGTTHDITGSNIWPGIDSCLRLHINSANRFDVNLLNASKQIQYYFSEDGGATWSANSPDDGAALGDDPVIGPYINGTVRIYAHNNPATDTKITYWQGPGGSAAWNTRTVYNTSTGMDCTVNVRWSQYHHFSPNTYDIAYWKSDYPTNLLYVGVDSGEGPASVAAVAMTAAAAMPAPTVAGTQNPSVSGVVATAAAAMPIPVVAGTENATVTGVAAVASAAMPSPVVSGTTAGDGLVNAVTMTAIALAIAPVISGVQNGAVSAMPMSADAGTGTPTISGGAVVAAVTMTASGTMPGPTISGVQNALILAVVLAAAASMPAPVISNGDNVIVSAATAEALAAMLAPIAQGTTGNALFRDQEDILAASAASGLRAKEDILAADAASGLREAEDIL